MIVVAAVGLLLIAGLAVVIIVLTSGRKTRGGTIDLTGAPVPVRRRDNPVVFDWDDPRA